MIIDLILNDEDERAVTQLRDEIFPTASLQAVALKLLRDELVRCGVRSSGQRNRSRGAKRSAPLP